MKNFTLGLLGLIIPAAAFAQTPLQQTKSAVFEFSDTWCTPCGAYGIDVSDSLAPALVQQNKGYLIGVKTTSTPSSLNAVGGQIMFDNFAVDGVPSFMINNSSVDDGCTHNNAADVQRMLNEAGAFNAIPAVAGIAANMSIVGTKVMVTAKSKFWNATTGDYYMAVLLAEDGIRSLQHAYPLDTATHRNLMRGSMSAADTLNAFPWGEFIGTSSIAAGQEFTKNYQTEIDPSWNVNNLVAFAVIFRKNPNDTFETVNIEQAINASASVASVSSLKEVSVYPNPASDKINISIDAVEHINAAVRITDMQGRVVYNLEHVAIGQGQNDLQIKTGGLRPGNYIVTFSDDRMGAIARSIVIR